MTKIEKLSSKDCAAQLGELKSRLRDVNARLAEIKPSPHETRFAAGRPPLPNVGPASPGAPRFDPLGGAGPEYRRVALEGSPAELAALDREREELEAESRQLGFRIHALTEREKEAMQEERLAAAPKKLSVALKGTDAVLDRLAAARVELKAAEDAKGAHLREVENVRKLVGEKAPGLTPAQVRRALEDERGELRWISRIPETGQMAENRALRHAVYAYLEPLPVPLLQRLRERFPVAEDAFSGQLHSSQAVGEDVARVRARMIAEGRLDDVNDFHVVAREVVEARFATTKTRPSREKVDSWLTRSRTKVAAEL